MNGGVELPCPKTTQPPRHRALKEPELHEKSHQGDHDATRQAGRIEVGGRLYEALGQMNDLESTGMSSGSVFAKRFVEVGLSGHRLKCLEMSCENRTQTDRIAQTKVHSLAAGYGSHPVILRQQRYQMRLPGEWICAASPIKNTTPPELASGCVLPKRVKNRSAIAARFLNRVDHKVSDTRTG
jgi:hypothetical protein